MVKRTSVLLDKVRILDAAWRSSLVVTSETVVHKVVPACPRLEETLQRDAPTLLPIRTYTTSDATCMQNFLLYLRADGLVVYGSNSHIQS